MLQNELIKLQMLFALHGKELLPSIDSVFICSGMFACHLLLTPITLDHKWWKGLPSLSISLFLSVASSPECDIATYFATQKESVKYKRLLILHHFSIPYSIWDLLFELLLSTNCIFHFMPHYHLNNSPPQSQLSRISHGICPSWALQVAFLNRLFKNDNWKACAQKSCQKSFYVALL